jgi:hypothetical protein
MWGIKNIYTEKLMKWTTKNLWNKLSETNVFLYFDETKKRTYI